MAIITSQIVVFIIMFILGFHIFKHFEFHLNSSSLAISALMIALSTILQLFSLTIPLMGFPSLKIGFSQLPIMMLGILLNPAYAFFAGTVKDVVGLIIAPVGFPYLGFTLNTILVGVIPAMVYHTLRTKNANTIQHMALAALGLLSLMSAVIVLKPTLIGLDSLEISWEMKSLLLLLLGFISFMLGRMYVVSNDVLYSIVALSVFLVELIVNFFSTPIYLNIMYGIPIGISLMVRMFKAAFMYPITVSVGYYLLKLMLRLDRSTRSKENQIQ